MSEEVKEKEVALTEEVKEEPVCEVCGQNPCVCEDDGKKDVEEPSEEEIAAKRLEMIKTYNEQNKGNSWIEDEKPTEEEVKAIAQEYKEKVEAFNAIKFTIADEANALRVAKFLKKWNEDSVCWENEGWRGAIFFDAIIKNFIEECETEAKPLVVDWQTLTYLFMFMRNIKGVGLKGAIKFAAIAEEYNKLLDVIGDEFTKHEEGGKKLQLLQDRWAAYEHGFKLHYCEEGTAEEVPC